ncbi:DNA-binding MarR family transcriptional regulator [Mycolicibacterium sp. BK556]|uniref:MarR family winged helix-turn-helix transcriptional regulator n=1 Tax=unclassified Mycolicibacterium TaxID=2636767 RepID=UPI0016090561|nr:MULTISPECIES: MarR family winged helix-turn-helix transcriptional regulator [unclassified Mycolicibacterium]MBB3607050.1 DNA-binding MarR family transcriptional regulator [Mycolicibacterium sp. BK556]MBB3636840.1 DNA-binding MarR family transcriptional regulator [Mycolicibacterium sp. BK607]
MAEVDSGAAAVDPIGIASDAIRLEIVIWNRVDTALRIRHQIGLAVFEVLHFTAKAPTPGIRISELAQALGASLGGTSRLIDRVLQTGLISRTVDTADRRVSHVALTTAGKRKLTATSKTYTAEVAAMLDPALTSREQHQLHTLTRRLLVALDPQWSPGATRP